MPTHSFLRNGDDGFPCHHRLLQRFEAKVKTIIHYKAVGSELS
jgi:hypothetical protein